MKGRARYSRWKTAGSGEDDAAEHGPAGADEQAEQDDGFERDVGGEEVGDDDADPDAEVEGNEEEGEEREGLGGGAVLGERGGSGRCGTRARALATAAAHAELDQQRDEDEAVVEHLMKVQGVRVQVQRTAGQS